MSRKHWIELAKDGETRIETIHAHFGGHVHAPHWHDSYVVGVTTNGVHRLRCRHCSHLSVPGAVFLLAPGEIHHVDTPSWANYSFRMLDLDPAWMESALHTLAEEASADGQLSFPDTVVDNPRLATATVNAFQALNAHECRIVRQAALDALLLRLVGQVQWRPSAQPDAGMRPEVHRARDYLHAQMCQDISMEDLAKVAGVSRFRLTRAFKAAFGMAPHAYLIHLRLNQARRLLAAGESPARVAATLGFSDQSHLGRWFSRVYRLTPAQYRKLCLAAADGEYLGQAAGK